MNEYAIGNFVLNGGLVVLVCCLVKKCVNGMETTIANNKKELAESTKQTTTELKDAIHENRDEYRDTSQRIFDLIKELSDHVAVANGRTAKLEGEVKTQRELCRRRRHTDLEAMS